MISFKCPYDGHGDGYCEYGSHCPTWHNPKGGGCWYRAMHDLMFKLVSSVQNIESAVTKTIPYKEASDGDNQ